jgi:hypothetical protein
MTIHRTISSVLQYQFLKVAGSVGNEHGDRGVSAFGHTLKPKFLLASGNNSIFYSEVLRTPNSQLLFFKHMASLVALRRLLGPGSLEITSSRFHTSSVVLAQLRRKSKKSSGRPCKSTTSSCFVFDDVEIFYQPHHAHD